ncbi:MAG: TonB-dependent receptor plug domain-containing protein [Verrucomicrobia bacterium]|nr:TonB-dependent receptor plug domain-containing protein [Verrucomicrobiota bacterium]
MKTNLRSLPSLPIARAALLGLALLSAALPAQTITQRPAGSTTGAAEEKAIELSPFTVTTTKDVGYFAENTLAGSRLNTNLADLAASVTVVTKQQMDDTASIDINDIFKYEANTEGSSTYSPSIVDRNTVKDAVAGYSFGNDGTTTTNAQANRIRGLTTPDAAINNFSSNNRIPLDGYNTQSIEISRGPNSLLFGLGTPAGVVNQSLAQAALNRNSNTVTVRTDQNGSIRTTLALNRSLIPDKLAVYGAFLYDNRQFERTPSSDRYRRHYGAVTYKPFKHTVIRGFAENYENEANRPNFFTPRDQVTPWLQSGRPVYDALTRTITIRDTGRVLGPYVSNVNSPGYVAAVNTILGGNAMSTTTSPLFVPGIVPDDVARPVRMIDNGTVWGFFARQPQFYAPAHTNPVTATPTAATLGWTQNDPRFLIADRLWTASGNLPTPTTTINGRTYTYGSWNWAGVSDKSIYDWTNYNTVQPNFSSTRAANYNLELEQQLLPNLYLNAGWFRQDIDDTSNLGIAQLQGATIGIDTNTRLINGAPNPYVGLPFIYEGAGGGFDTFFQPQTDDNYRVMLAYDLDLTKRSGWTRWLGRHRLLGLWQEQDSLRTVERWRMNFVDGDADARLRYTRNLTLSNQAMWSNTVTTRHYYLASPGDPQGRVSHSAGFYGNQGWNRPFNSNVEVWNYNTGQFQQDRLVENIVFSDNGSRRTQREVKGTQFALQSYLWDDRLVTTFGWRQDDYRARITTSGALTDISGRVTEPALPITQLYVDGFTGQINRDLVMRRWARWDKLSGSTKTLGGAFRPLKGWRSVQRLGGEGSLVSEFLHGLTLYYNQSDNFNPPATYQTDYFFKPLPKPTGEGKDGGFGFSLFQNKLVARVNWYETESLNERTNAANTLLTRLAYGDTTLGIPWASAVQRIRNGIAAGRTLNQIISVTNWNTDAVNNVADEANQRKIYELIQLPYLYYSGLSSGGTQDSQSKGVEVQLTYNPSRNWTMKFSGSKAQASYRNVAPQYDAWLAERMPKWTTIGAPEIPDFVDPNTSRRWSLRQFWSAYGYATQAQIENTDGNTSSQGYFATNVESQVALAKALEGANSPLEREYHASFLTNYTFTGGPFKGFSVGGSQRWESKAAIGFYGKVGDPRNAPTVINLNDITRPVYDSGNFYTDLWLAYSLKLDRNRMGLKLQLNVNNIMEDGRLMPTQVNFDGSPWAYRIIDPRQFVFTATLTF